MAPPISDAQARLDAAYDDLTRVVGWITNADNKALIWLTFDSVILAGVTVNWSGIWAVLTGNSQNVTAYWLTLGFGIAFATFFSASVCCLIFCLFPRTKAQDASSGGSSLLYFGSIASVSSKESFVTEFQRLTAPAIERELLYQVYAISKIATKKFWFLKASVICTVLAALSFAGAAASFQLRPYF